MTVTAQNTQAVYLGNGITADFAFPFYVPDISYLKLYTVNPTTGLETPVAVSTATVTGIGLAAGGSVHYPNVGSPVPIGTSFMIRREVPYGQSVSLSNQNAFYGSVVEGGLDALSMQIQQLFNLSGAVNVQYAQAAALTVQAILTQIQGFNGKYYGPYATDPTINPVTGGPVVQGDSYYNTGLFTLKFYNGSVWTVLNPTTFLPAPMPSGSVKGNVSGAAPIATATVIIAVATPGVVTWTAHGRTAGDPMIFTTTGALLAGLLPNKVYYVATVLTANTFSVAATYGGAAIAFSGTQSGTHTATVPATALPQDLTIPQIYDMIRASFTTNAQTGTSYTVLAADIARLLTFSNTNAVTVSLPITFGAGFTVDVENMNTGIVSLVPTSGTIAGLTSLIIPRGTGGRLYFDGTNWQFLGTIPQQQGIWLLNTLTASASAALIDTTSFTTVFDDYELVFQNILPATNSVSLQLQVQSGGTFQTTTYSSASTGINTGAAQGANSTTGLIITATTVSNTGPGMSGLGRLFAVNSTTTRKLYRGDTSYGDTSAVICIQYNGGFWNGGNGAVTGVQLLASAGAITSGVMKVFGRR